MKRIKISGTEGNYGTGSVLGGTQHLQENAGTAWQPKEGFTKKLVVDQGFRGWAGFLETSIREKASGNSPQRIPRQWKRPEQNGGGRNGQMSEPEGYLAIKLSTPFV